MIAIQADNLSPDAAEVLPVLLKPAPRNPRAARVIELMRRWNRFMLANRPEPLIYSAWLTELQRGLIADELGAALYADLRHERADGTRSVKGSRRQLDVGVAVLAHEEGRAALPAKAAIDNG